MSCFYYAALASHQDNNGPFFDVPQSAHLLLLLYQMFVFIYIPCLNLRYFCSGERHISTINYIIENVNIISVFMRIKHNHLNQQKLR